MNPIWRKSSRSASAAQCVELHRTLTQVRDSKNADGRTLRADVTALVAAVKAGRFD